MPESESPDHSHAGNFQVKQKRARSQLSCKPCRTGKLKCDRLSPCIQCQKRSRESSCVYLPPAQKGRTGQNVRNRIQHLEQLVVDLMNSNQTSNGQSTKGSSGTDSQGRSPSQDFNTLPSSGLTPPYDKDGYAYSGSSVDETQRANEGAFGRMQISKKEMKYVGESHWSAVLTSISDLKRDLSDDDASQEDEDESQELEDVYNNSPAGIENLLRAPKRKSKVELINALPLRSEVDRLVYQWFNAADAFKPVLHPPTFQEEYTRFWQDPLKTPTMWIALLYAILSLSAGSQFHFNPNPASSEAGVLLAMSIEYHELAASAAVLADYTTMKAYTIEFLSLYIGGLRSQTAFIDMWQLIGLMIRLSLRAGYHKDGSHFPSLSIFEQEMRRRHWHQMFMVDLLISFQLGLPSLMRAITSDTKPPSNLHDSDISAKMTVLPPSRPANELTPVSYIIAKVDLCRVFSQVYDMTQSPTLPSHDQVIRLDNELEAAKEELPMQVQIRPLHQFVADKPETIMWAFNLRLLYLKVKIVLHRPFMASRRNDSFSLASRQSCVDAAMCTLSHHHEVYLASQTGDGIFARCYMASISTHDYLLAAMILCLELSHQCDDASRSLSDTSQQPEEKRQEMVNLLKITRDIWTREPEAAKTTAAQATWQQQSVVHETKKASRALDAMVVRVEAMGSPSASNTTSTNTMSSTPSMFEPAPTIQSAPDLAFMGPSWGATSWTPPNMTANGDVALNVVDSMMNVPEDQFDWTTFDTAFTSAPNFTDEAGWNFDPEMMPDMTRYNFAGKDATPLF
ncbi:hypothetical protein KVT40_001009 [Elsinoe batatas]|uniref:Zn(2)-C6 fungal-type domain-containing protein n=1 Tax=Elsinoe batatas TaxID=2601811 RepID=A0A8K0LB38_9PEZI|nr:hypothetical protein KVT40_001009 [Elsinoe batatas]